jgi:hypothetical protein
MNKKRYDLLENCIEILVSGGSVDDCKRKHPDLSEEIQDMLIIVKKMMGPPIKVSVEQMDKNLNRVLAQARMIESTDSKPLIAPRISRFAERARQLSRRLPTFKPLASRLSVAFAITALLVILSGGLVITSAKSIPGEPLYRVKRVVEDIRVYLVPNPEIREKYEDDYNQERVDEVIALVRLKRVQAVNFEGVIESMDATNWVVSGIQVSIQDGTILIGTVDSAESFFIGSMVEVEGITNTTGSVTASRVHLREYQFYGLVEKIDTESWQIDNIKVSISSQTQIENGINAGDSVLVTARLEDQGLYAIAISHVTEATKTPMTTSNPSNLLLPTSEDDYDEMYDVEEVQSTEFEQEDNTDDHTKEAIETETATEYSENEHHDLPTIIAPTEFQEQEGTVTPEYHETPEPTGENEDDH